MNEDPRIEAVRRYNSSRQSDQLRATLALCDAYETSAIRLTDPQEIPDSVDITVALLAAESFVGLDRGQEARALFEAAELYARRIPDHSGQVWLVETIACRARGAIEFGDASLAHAAIAGFDPGLLGLLASGSAPEIEAWETRETWVLSPPSIGVANGWQVLAGLYHAAALLLMASGDLLAAIATAQRGLQHLHAQGAGTRTILSARLEYAEAMALLQLGRLEAVRALPMMQDPVAVALPAALLANRLLFGTRLAVLSGQINEAGKLIGQLGALATSNGNDTDAARWHLRAADLFIYMNQPRRAQLFIERVSESATAEHPAIASQLRHLRALMADRSNAADIGRAFPVSWHNRAPAPKPEMDWLGNTDFQPLPRRLGLPAYDLESELSEWSVRIRMMVDRGHADEALTALAKCTERFRTVASPLISARLTVLTVIVKASQAPDSDLIWQVMDAAEVFRRIGSPLDELQALRLLLTLGANNAAGSDPVRARVDDLLSLVTIGLDPLSTELFNEDKVTARDLSFERELLLLNATEGQSSLLARIFGLENADTRIVRRVYGMARAARIWGKQVPVVLRWSAVRTELASMLTDAASLMFVVLPTVTLVVRRRRTTVSWQVRKVPAARIRLLVTRWHHLNNEWWYATSGGYGVASAAMASVAEEARKQLDSVAEELAAQLGLEGEFAQAGTPLWLESDGPLVNFPFSALRSEGRYLVQCRPVANRFTYILARRANAASEAGLSVSISGMLSVQASSRRQATTFEKLPSAQRESKIAAAWFARQGLKSKLLSDEGIPPAASREALLSTMAAVSHLHFAGHGTFNPASRYESGLVVPDGKGEGTLLSMADIEEMTAVPGYVAMTSCYSADSITLPGGEALGLTQSMLRAGANTVLASFWRVTDRVSERVVARYYRNCIGSRYVAALAEAQRQAIAGKIKVPGIAEVTHPYCWAGFGVHHRVSWDIW